MVISTLVGSISYPEEKEVLYSNPNERFFKVSLSFGACTIPAVCSEFLLRDIEGKVSVQGYLTSTYRNIDGKRRLFTYFQIIDITPVHEDVEDYDVIDLDVILTKIGDFKISERNGRAYLPLVGKCYTGYKRSAVIHMLATETLARQLKDAKVDDKLVAAGHIHQRGEPIEIVLTEVKELTGKEEAENA